jgi:hypothetical protein
LHEDEAARVKDESIRLEGNASLTRAFGSWFAWSPIADTVRAARIA